MILPSACLEATTPVPSFILLTIEFASSLVVDFNTRAFVEASKLSTSEPVISRVPFVAVIVRVSLITLVNVAPVSTSPPELAFSLTAETSLTHKHLFVFPEPWIEISSTDVLSNATFSAITVPS